MQTHQTLETLNQFKTSNMKKLFILLSITLVISSCKKESTTPTTPTNTTINTTTTVLQTLKWNKMDYMVQYEADGVTERSRTEYKYDSEGRPIEFKMYMSGNLASVNRDYIYNGNEVTYYMDSYTGGVVTSTSKMVVGYHNN